MIEQSRLVAAPEVALLREDIRRRGATAGELRDEVEDSNAESEQLRKQLSDAHELRTAQERALQEKDERILLLQREVKVVINRRVTIHHGRKREVAAVAASRSPLFEESSGSSVQPSTRRESRVGSERSQQPPQTAAQSGAPIRGVIKA